MKDTVTYSLLLDFIFRLWLNERDKQKFHDTILLKGHFWEAVCFIQNVKQQHGNMGLYRRFITIFWNHDKLNNSITELADKLANISEILKIMESQQAISKTFNDSKEKWFVQLEKQHLGNAQY